MQAAVHCNLARGHYSTEMRKFATETKTHLTRNSVSPAQHELPTHLIGGGLVSRGPRGGGGAYDFYHDKNWAKHRGNHEEIKKEITPFCLSSDKILHIKSHQLWHHCLGSPNNNVPSLVTWVKGVPSTDIPVEEDDIAVTHSGQVFFGGSLYHPFLTHWQDFAMVRQRVCRTGRPDLTLAVGWLLACCWMALRAVSPTHAALQVH